MGTDIIQTKSFEERMKDRIKEDLGSLLSDEELSQMVRKCTNDIFFKSKTEPDGSYKTKTTPPLLETIVKELLETKVRVCVKQYLNENREEVEKCINTSLEKGIGEMLLAAVGDVFSNSLQNFKFEIMNSLSVNQ